MTADLLQETFRCEKHITLFPSGMPLRACLRRQCERTELAKRPTDEWPPAKPFCARDCPLGRENLARAAAAGIPTMTCSKCGGALIGAAQAQACPTCAARMADAGREVPRGATGRAPPSTRLWNGEVPDVPIAPPSPRQTPDLEQLRRAADARQRLLVEYCCPKAPAPPPAAAAPDPEPTEEDEMAKPDPKLCTKCHTHPLRSDNTSGICSPCRKAPGGRSKSPGGKAVASAVPRPARPVSAARARAASDVEAATLEELLEQRDQARATVADIEIELRRRRDELATALGEDRRAAG